MIIMAGCLLAVLTLLPRVRGADQGCQPRSGQAQATNKVVVHANPDECSFQFNPTGTLKFTSFCDIAKQALAAASVSYDNAAAPAAL